MPSDLFQNIQVLYSNLCNRFENIYRVFLPVIKVCFLQQSKFHELSSTKFKNFCQKSKRFVKNQQAMDAYSSLKQNLTFREPEIAACSQRILDSNGSLMSDVSKCQSL